MTWIFGLILFLIVWYAILYLSDTEFHAQCRAQEEHLKYLAEWEHARLPERPKRSSWSEFKTRVAYRWLAK